MKFYIKNKTADSDIKRKQPFLCALNFKKNDHPIGW